MNRKIIISGTIFSLFLLVMMPNISAIEHKQIIDSIDEKQKEFINKLTLKNSDFDEYFKDITNDNATIIQKIKVFLGFLFLPFSLLLHIPKTLVPIIKNPIVFIYNLIYDIPGLILFLIVEIFGYIEILIFLPLLVIGGIIGNILLILLFDPIILTVMTFEIIAEFLTWPYLICVALIESYGTLTLKEILNNLPPIHITFP